MGSSGLKFESIEQLLTQCTISEQQTRKLEESPCTMVYNSLKKLRDEADRARGDLELEYRHLIKAGELGKIIMQNNKFPYWDNANKTLFYHDYEKIIEKAGKVQNTLEKKYDQSKIRKTQQDREIEKKTEKKSSGDFQKFRELGNLISPRELVKRVEDDTPKKSALIFDFRQDQSESIDYRRSEMITVFQVPAEVLISTLTFNALRDNLSVNQRSLLQRVSTYDYIVLMDDDTPIMTNGTPQAGTRASFLHKAFTVYMSSEMLKSKTPKRPIFMDGGFRSWKNHYPSYTSSLQPVSARSGPSDGLDNAIMMYLPQSELSHIKYPDLMAKAPQEPPIAVQRPSFPIPPTTPTFVPPSVPQRPGAPIFGPPPPQTVKPSVPLVPDRTAKPATVPTLPTLPTVPQIPEKPKIQPDRPPTLDRATKPVVSKQNESALLSIYDQMIMAIDRSSRRAGQSTPGATGLFNMGNTCFMSATLQCLFQSPGLAEVFSKGRFVSKVNPENRMGSKGVVSAAFSALFDAIWQGKYEAIRPDRFLQLFAELVSHVLSDGRQHDASEFHLFLLDSLHEDTNQAKRIGFEQNYRGGPNIQREAVDFLQKHALFSNSPVNRIFGGVSVSEIRCQTCGESSATFEENTIISVELTSTSSCSLDSCLKSHFSETILDNDSRWNCPQCKTPRVSSRRSKLWSLPPILTIHLKRFALFNGDFEKNTAAVSFDAFRLDCRPFLHEAARPDRTVYRLYATTIHNGRLNSGHYTSIACHQKTEKWLRFDDESVRPVDVSAIDPSLAYILFYKRC